MALETIGLGTTANDGTGDVLRTAGAKINAVISAVNGLGTAAEESAADLLDRDNHTGSQGIDTVSGLQDALDARIIRVVHGSTANTARPEDAVYVEWVGSVEPDNAEENDTWVDTSA
jgi:hypothetical protein